MDLIQTDFGGVKNLTLEQIKTAQLADPKQLFDFVKFLYDQLFVRFFGQNSLLVAGGFILLFLYFLYRQFNK